MWPLAAVSHTSAHTLHTLPDTTHISGSAAPAVFRAPTRAAPTPHRPPFNNKDPVTTLPFPAQSKIISPF